MGLLEIMTLAFGLSMDAFAVSVTLGLSVKALKIKEALLPGLFFGFFQAAMPLAGFFAGSRFADRAQEAGPWVAFVLLGVIGGKMIKERGEGKGGGAAEGEGAFKAARMLALSFATSIDALAVGVTFAFLEVRALAASALIGAVTFFISTAGVKIGNIFGAKYKSKAEFLGGLALIFLGARILGGHLFF